MKLSATCQARLGENHFPVVGLCLLLSRGTHDADLLMPSHCTPSTTSRPRKSPRCRSGKTRRLFTRTPNAIRPTCTSTRVLTAPAVLTWCSEYENSRRALETTFAGLPVAPTLACNGHRPHGIEMCCALTRPVVKLCMVPVYQGAPMCKSSCTTLALHAKFLEMFNEDVKGHVVGEYHLSGTSSRRVRGAGVELHQQEAGLAAASNREVVGIDNSGHWKAAAHHCNRLLLWRLEQFRKGCMLRVVLVPTQPATGEAATRGSYSMSTRAASLREQC
jgi:hypothetical protein